MEHVNREEAILMRIFVKFFAVDMPIHLSNCSFDLSEGAVIGDVLDECLKLPQIVIEENDFKASMVLLNGTLAKLDDPVIDGDTIKILRMLQGG